MQQRLKPAAGAARARIVASELFDELLVPAHDAHAALDARLGREALAALASDLESSRGRSGRASISWHFSGVPPVRRGADDSQVAVPQLPRASGHAAHGAHADERTERELPALRLARLLGESGHA